VKLLTINTTLPNRNYGLDVMRSIAVLMVFTSHAVHFFETYTPKVHVVAHFVMNGVELFFALSGFLIGRMLLKQFNTPEVAVGHELLVFLKRRWYKTIPVYFLALFINFVFAYIVTGYHRDFNWTFLFFLQNFNSAEFWFFPVSYSLAIEEWFYLLFPLVFITLILCFRNANRSKLLILASAIFIVAGLIIRSYRFYNADYMWDPGFRKALITRLDASVYGVILAVSFSLFQETIKRMRLLLILIGAAIYILCIAVRIQAPESYFYHVLYFTFIPLSFTLAMPYFYWMQVPGKFTHQLFTQMSLIAFAFYLLHLSPLMDLFLLLPNGENLFRDICVLIAYTITTALLSILWYKYIELPFTNLRDR
jgi:peptidoglycan/LPS O-acetylase OafA/YrhL